MTDSDNLGQFGDEDDTEEETQEDDETGLDSFGDEDEGDSIDPREAGGEDTDAESDETEGSEYDRDAAE